MGPSAPNTGNIRPEAEKTVCDKTELLGSLQCFLNFRSMRIRWVAFCSADSKVPLQEILIQQIWDEVQEPAFIKHLHASTTL